MTKESVGVVVPREDGREDGGGGRRGFKVLDSVAGDWDV